MAVAGEREKGERSYQPYGEVEISPEWFKKPALIINPRPFVVSAQDELQVVRMGNLREKVFSDISEEFERLGCETEIWQGGKVENSSPYKVILNPVFVGSLPREVTEAFNFADLASYKESLRENLLENWPLAFTLGKRHMRLTTPSGQSLHPNFTNVLFIEDSQHRIENLDYNHKLILLRMFMAKHGAFRNLVAPYEEGLGGLTFDKVIMGSLEGGHPELSLREVAKRLMVFGSLTEVGGSVELKSPQISKGTWESSLAVDGVRRIGRFLGQRGNLSAPVEISELVRNPLLAAFESHALNYSRQAEGAIEAFATDLPKIDSLPWTGLPVVTSSGRFGTVKTDLQLDDLVPVVPLKVQSDSGFELKVGTLPVEGYRVKKPSVEAEEFTHPLLDLSEVDGEKYLMRLTKIDGGYVYDREGDIVVPPFRGVIHLHRGFSLKDSLRVVKVDADISRFPPVGCGVDLMFGMSHDAMKRAFDLWLQGGQRASVLVFPVPNHGTNLFATWAKDKNGVIPDYPFASVEEVVNSGELVFTEEVPQV